MNERIQQLVEQAGPNTQEELNSMDRTNVHVIDVKKFAELLVEAVLDQVKERAYYTGDRDWSDEVDRTWIQLEFGYGKLHDAKHGVEE